MQKCEACSTLTFLYQHHIMSTSCGGTSDKGNLANVCPTCHRLVHKGNIVLEGKFMTSEGIQLIWHKQGAESITGNQPEVFIMGKK